MGFLPEERSAVTPSEAGQKGRAQGHPLPCQEGLLYLHAVSLLLDSYLDFFIEYYMIGAPVLHS